MIITQLCGGLGNQMFQYAFGKRLSIHHKTELLLDLSWYKLNKTDTQRNYSLDAFNLPQHFASPEQIKTIIGSGNSKLFTIFNLHSRRAFIKQQGVAYSEKYTQAPKECYLQGYWQSEKFFEAVKDSVALSFSLNDNILSKIDQKFLNNIHNSNSISIHIRRGDYINNALTHKTHGVCDTGYYLKALEYISKKMKDCHAFVFSDDISWVKQNLKLPLPATYSKSYTDYEEMYFMSQCKHHIIANSTFSWWGAWLNESPEKIVIAPEKWFNDSSIDSSDLIPTQWTKL